MPTLRSSVSFIPMRAAGCMVVCGVLIAAGLTGAGQAGAALPQPVKTRVARRDGAAMRELQKLMPHRPAFSAERSSSLAELGRALFADRTLSTPRGQACSSCHSPSVGFRFPDSAANVSDGVPSGAIPTRFGPRSVPTISYAQFIPEGIPSAHFRGGEQLFIGGMFWDGRATRLEHQATFPFQDPNEMNNLRHGLGSPELVVKRLEHSRNAEQFKAVFGDDIFSHPVEEVFTDLADALGAYERSPEVSPFSSKFDLFLAGRVELTPTELEGFQLFTGTVDGKSTGEPFRKNAQCSSCHGIPDDPIEGPYVFSFHCYANIGVPRNPTNPFYQQTDQQANPQGYNPLGENYVDFGLGDLIYPLNGLPIGNMGDGSNGFGDFLSINGAVKAPTLRNVDKRPRPNFVKPYMHNGVFKSLKEVVHFYNARNLTTEPGEIIDFNLEDPYGGLTGGPLFDRPELIGAALANPGGLSAEEGGELGNLQLTDAEEDAIVAFLQTLSDGYFVPELPTVTLQPESVKVPVGAPVRLTCAGAGAPSPSYRWYRGDTPLEDVVYTSGSLTPTLLIDQASLTDGGDDYHCVITNSAGSVSTELVSVTVVE